MIIANAFTVEPRASVTDAMSPRTTSEKNSAEPKVRATAARGGAKRTTIVVATVPAKKDPMAAAASAGPARPLRAISCPSMAVTAADDSPGRLMRIAVVDPPYCAP
jgi:hypothetical protein